MATFEEKNPFSWQQCTISHIEHCSGKKTWIGFLITSASTVFTRPGPSDYYQFPHLKRWLCGRRFESNEEVEWETEEYFGRFDESYYWEGIEKLELLYWAKESTVRNKTNFWQKNKFLFILSRQYPTPWYINELLYTHISVSQCNQRMK